jgi:hypothetical protein
MLDVLDSTSLKHESHEIKGHYQRLFEQVLNSGVTKNMGYVLRITNDQEVAQNGIQISKVKLDVLKCLGLLTYGVRVFTVKDLMVSNNQQVGILEATYQCLSDGDLLQAIFGNQQNN